MAASTHLFVGDRVIRWLNEPLPVLRLELVRIAAPLAILGFMSSRVAHADEWLGDAGFRVPDLGTNDYRQPLYIGALSSNVAWIVAAVFVVSGLMVAAGWKARRAAVVFACVAAFVALDDRLAAFSVSKLAPVIGFALAASPCGRRFGVDAWLAKRRGEALPDEVASGSVRFFQLLLPTIYCASGIAKAKGDWITHPYVLWSHLHDTYQTSFTVFMANAAPPFAWVALKWVTLVFETFAPIWLAIPRTRTVAVLWAVSMHAMIGLMFGPVLWFGILMGSLVFAAFAPETILTRIAARVRAV